MAAPACFTFDYLREQLCVFRRMMGERAVMEDAERRDRALGALMYVWFTAKCTPEQETLAQSWMDATLLEFMRRCEYADLRMKPAHETAG